MQSQRTMRVRCSVSACIASEAAVHMTSSVPSSSIAHSSASVGTPSGGASSRAQAAAEVQPPA